MLKEPPGLGSGGGSAGSSEPGSAFISTGDEDMVVTTDENGRFRMRTPAGDVNYYVAASGYDLFQGAVTVSVGASATVNVALTKASGTTVALIGFVYTSAGGALTPAEGADVTAAQVDRSSRRTRARRRPA